jgi:hypothetical protein
MLQVRRRFLPVYVLIWITVLSGFVLALTRGGAA